MKVYEGFICYFSKANHIFVYGSNEAGRHGRGAARYAFRYFGAILGQGVGLQGSSYAIPTLSSSFSRLSLETVSEYVEDFLSFAREHPEYTFFLTSIGTGLAGFTCEQIAPLFRSGMNLENLIFPLEFARLLGDADEIVNP